MLVQNPPSQGGITQYCILLTNALSANASSGSVELTNIGFKSLFPKLLYPGPVPPAGASGIDFEGGVRPIVTWYNPLSWVRIFLALRKCDIFHFHWYTPVFAPVYLTALALNSIFTKKKVVMTAHCIEPHEPSFLDKFLIHHTFRHVDHFVVHAQENKSRLVDKYGVADNHISVIEHGPFSFFENWNEGREKARNGLGLKDEPVILFFGYIRKYKGLSYLLDALPEVLRQIPNAKLLVAGLLWGKWDDYIGGLSPEVRSRIIANTNYIPDKDVHTYFEAADIVVLPYNNPEQTISGPLLTSLAFGKPTIVSSIGGIKGTIKDGENGILVEPGNVEELSEKIVALLSDPALMKKLGANAKKEIAKYSWKEVAKKYSQVYSNLPQS